MTAALRLVSQSDLPEPPYAPDIRARGWAFDLDLERIHQSETWVLCPPEQRPWLLMLWASAWLSSPVGTWPQNDAVIAARIGMDARQFAAHRDILMRGWYLACDGLYYHPVISEMVARRQRNAGGRISRRAAS